MAGVDPSPRASPLPVFLPAPSPPPRGQPSLTGTVARMAIGKYDAGTLKDVISAKLANYFGGAAGDYKVATFSDSFLAVFFLSWAARESAIGHSPLWLDGFAVSFSHWVEPGEAVRGHLKYKV